MYLNLNSQKNILIFGKLNEVEANSFLMHLKNNLPNFNCIYISSLEYSKNNCAKVIAFCDNSNKFTVDTLNYLQLIKSLEKNTFSLLVNSEMLQIKKDIIIFLDNYSGIDIELLGSIGTADFLKILNLKNSASKKINSRLLLSINYISFDDLQKFDNFIIRMTNYSNGTMSEFYDNIKFYAGIGI